MTSRWSPGLAEMDILATAVRECQVKDRVLRPRDSQWQSSRAISPSGTSNSYEFLLAIAKNRDADGFQIWSVSKSSIFIFMMFD